MANSLSQNDVYGFPIDDQSSDEDEIYSLQSTIVQQTSHSLNLHMQEITDDFTANSTKSTFYSNEASHRIYETTRSDCAVAIDRLVLIDGWKGKLDANGHDEAMTLVVLKLALAPEGHSTRLTHASLQLKLKAATKGGTDPQLIAWGPFRRPEKWNITKAHKRTNVTPSAKISGGFAGQSVSVGIKRNVEQEWDENFTDHGISIAKGDAQNSKRIDANQEQTPNAVLWQVFENGLTKRGICHEFRVAALFSRPGTTRDSATTDKYLASVKVTAQISGARAMARRFFQLGRDSFDTIIWAVDAHPGSTDRCYAEGKDIVRGLDLDRLGTLIDPNNNTTLNPEWLNKWDRVEISAAESQLVKPFDNHTRSKNISGALSQSKPVPHGKKSDSPNPYSIHVESAAIEPQEIIGNPAAVIPSGQENDDNTDGAGMDEADDGSNDSDESAWASQCEVDAETDMDSDDKTKAQTGGEKAKRRGKYDTHQRLVSLERRAARAESRVALQDQRIYELQQTLARVSQALLGPAPKSPKKSRIRKGKRLGELQ